MQGGDDLTYIFDNEDDWSKVQSDMFDTLNPPLWIVFRLQIDGYVRDVQIPFSKIIAVETGK